MFISFEKGRFRYLWGWYSLVYLLFIASYFTIFLITGHTLIWRLDAAQQHVQLLQEFHANFWYWMRHLNGGPILWSWKLGLGGDTFALNSYYCLGDIFSYVALVVPTAWITGTFQVLIFVRLYCVGLSFCFFLSHFNFKKSTIMAGISIYMCNNYLLYAIIAQPFFLTPMMQFPLLLLAYHYYLQKRKWIPLLVIFCWIFFNSFYFAFIIGCGFGIYLLLEKISKNITWKSWFKQLFKTASIAIVGVLLTAALLIPELMAMSDSTRSADKDFANGMWLYPLEYYFKLTSQLIGSKGAGFWTSLGFLTPFVFALIFIFKRRKQYRLLANSFILSGIFILVPAAAAIFNAASSPSNRWLFMMLTPVSLSVCLFIEEFHTLSDAEKHSIKRWALIYTVMFAVAAIIGVSVGFIQLSSTLLTAGLWLISMIIMWRLLARKHVFAADIRHLLVTCTVINMCLCAISYTAPIFTNFVKETLKSGTYKNDTTNVYRGLDKKLKKSNNYRVSTQAYHYYVAGHQRLYNALSNRMNAIFSYYSVMQKSLGDFATAYGNSQYEANRPIQQVDNRTILQNYLGVKYLFTRNGKKQVGAYYTKAKSKHYKGKTYARYTTKNNYPILWWTNKVQTTSQSQKMSYSQREYMLSQGVVVSDSTNTNGLKKASLPKHSVVSLEYYIIDKNGKRVSASSITKKTMSNKYRIVLVNAKKYRHAELHVELTNISFSAYTLLSNKTTFSGKSGSANLMSLVQNTQYNPGFTISVKGKVKSKAKQADTSSLSNRYVLSSAVLNVGYYKHSLPQTLKLTFSTLGTYHFKLKVYAILFNKTYQKSVNKIRHNRLHNVKYSTNTVKATLNHKSTGIVTSSIPYSKGWSVYVDGKKVKTIKTNYGFLGFKVASGKHHVTLKYRTPGLKLGVIVSFASIICLGGYSLLRRKKSRYRKYKH